MVKTHVNPSSALQGSLHYPRKLPNKDFDRGSRGLHSSARQIFVSRGAGNVRPLASESGMRPTRTAVAENDRALQ